MYLLQQVAWCECSLGKSSFRFLVMVHVFRPQGFRYLQQCVVW